MWAALAFAAGTIQAARNGLARSLTGAVSPALNSWSRFTFNLPFSGALALALVAIAGAPDLTPAFYGYCAATALSQLLGNVALVAAFERSNFAQSIVFHKLEIVFAAIVGAVFFAENPSVAGWIGVATCGAGVVLMNLGRESGPGGWRRAFHLDTGALLSLACAMLLVVASFMLKEATSIYALANPRVGESRFEAAAHTLFHTTWMEVAVLSAFIFVFRRTDFGRVPQHWKRMAAIGATGFAGSLCWFWAYSIALVAYVKAVGQVESVLAVGMAIVVWHEREVWRQLPGVALVLAGIAIVLLG